MNDFSIKDVINGSESYWNEKVKKIEKKKNQWFIF